MKARLLTTLIALSLVAVCLSVVRADNAWPRERTLIDAGWKFHLGDLDYSANGVSVVKWQWKPTADPAAETAGVLADTSAEGWKDAATGDDVFRGRVGFAWYRTTLPAAPGTHHTLHFESVDDNATVYLNGKKLAYHEVWNDPFDVNLDPAWQDAGPNSLVVLVENTNGPGGIAGPCLLQTDTAAPTQGAPSPTFDDRSWRKVDLPHDWVVAGKFDPKEDRSHGYLPKGVGWYRKEFTLSEADQGKRVWLEFDGIYRNSAVWLNGKLLGRHASGYTSFYFDITDCANFGGKNLLAVRADANANEGWWYEGGGIYRHVYLTKLAPVHVAHWGTFVTSVVQDGDQGGKELADVTAKATVANETKADATCRVEALITDPRGGRLGAVETEVTVPAGGATEIALKTTVKKPQLWSIEKPNLYTLKTAIIAQGHVVDTVTTPFGIRTIRYDADKGFFLNGQSVKLKGTCNHQDLLGVGVALPDRMHVWRIEKLKEMGSNAFRCSHNPPAVEMLDACDRLGMVVMDENRHLGSSPEVLGQVESMVTRDRNHPSIIMWSMCNEEGAQGTEAGKKAFSAMMDTVHRFDTTRPISCAMNGGWGSGITGVEDLQGFNYSPNQYDPFHKAFPKMPIFASETASHVSDRGMYADDRERGYVSEYGGNPEWSWKPVAERDFVAGSFVWTGFDYRGEPSPYDWPCIASHFGIMDLCGFPKDSWWYYKAWWGDKPLVHILPHWNWAGKTGQEISVWCYGNTERVELFLNGVSVGIKEMPRYGHAEWRVKWAPGVLEARGLTGGKVVATDKRETTGDPARVQLQPVNTEIAADNEDVALIPVAILDAKGRVVPTADNEVSFHVTGPGRIVGVGNGDSSSHEPDKGRSRHAFNGWCMVVVQAADKTGEIKLTATSPGLEEASVVVRAR